MDSVKLAVKIRRDIIQMVHDHHASHVGSALSVVDILAVLYSGVMKVDPKHPDWENRDRLILSKGHAGAAVYATLAETGFFPRENLKQYYTNGSVYSGHVSHRGVPGVDFSTGSLGHGVCVAAGIALAGKRREKPYRVYTIIGDGECDEGSVWEMALFAHQQKLDNLIVIIDCNHMQAMGACKDVIDLQCLEDKWRSFGWNTVTVTDGNNHLQLKEVLRETDSSKPTCVVAHTIKGKGVSFMENSLTWHYRDPQGEDYIKAMQELGGLPIEKQLY